MSRRLTDKAMAALRTAGFVELAAGPLDLDYPDIYHLREGRGQLTGLEPPWREPSEAKAFIDGRNVVIAVLMPYNLLPKKTRSPQDHISHISIMASEWDYHTVFKDKLAAGLADFSKVHPEARVRLHVDNGPLPERQISMALGLTQPGKSQMVVSRRYGTAFYIGLVLLADSAFEQPVKTSFAYALHEACLSCDKCQSHCPSGALRAQGGFDGLQCISATTQFKGLLSDEQMMQMGQQLYGCDHCQLSCPLNSPLFKSLQPLEGIAPLQAVENNSMKPEELLYLSQKAYKRAYGHLGFSWRGVKTAKRNGLINMANSGEAKYISLIETYLSTLDQSADAVLFGTAQWALERLKALHRGERT